MGNDSGLRAPRNRVLDNRQPGTPSDSLRLSIFADIGLRSDNRLRPKNHRSLSYLWRLMAGAIVKMVPFHPDRCGGLQPVGWLGLRNQYTLSVLGMNVVLLLMTSRRLNLDWSWTSSPWMQCWRTSFLARLYSIGPLLPFRRGMIRAKGEWIDEIQQGFQVEFERLRIKLRSPQITKEDQESIERLQKISAFVGELPLWPFDASTLRKFLTAYIVPVVVSLGGQVVPLVLGWIRRSLV